MEPGVRSCQGHGGFILVMVLIVTAVGLLFGAGALLLFKYQCQLRIDRQHELEKVYAVRSMLNYIRKYPGGDEGRYVFGYKTWSERNLKVIAEPVKAIFPDLNNERHLDIGDIWGRDRYFGQFGTYPGQYDSSLDYEYGAVSNGVVMSNLKIGGAGDERKEQFGNTKPGGGRRGIVFTDLDATFADNVKWWVNIGMCDTGGWLQEDYGRRYFFNPLAFVDGEAIKDVMRLCIIRNVTNSFNEVGCRHGWPLSRAGERALVFQISPMAGSIQTDNNAIMTLDEYVCVGAAPNEIIKTTLVGLTNRPALCRMGMQIADNKISIFYIGNEKVNDDTSGGSYVFSDTMELTRDTYEYFAQGLFTNEYGKVQAPELRAVLEVEAASDKRTGEIKLDKSNYNFLSDFRVTPAYQYDVFIEYPAMVTNRATIAQKVSVYSRNESEALSTVFTYDTHGTEHKGFRRDEREYEREKMRKVGK